MKQNCKITKIRPNDPVGVGQEPNEATLSIHVESIGIIGIIGKSEVAKSGNFEVVLMNLFSKSRLETIKSKTRTARNIARAFGGMVDSHGDSKRGELPSPAQ